MQRRYIVPDLYITSISTSDMELEKPTLIIKGMFRDNDDNSPEESLLQSGILSLGLCRSQLIRQTHYYQLSISGIRKILLAIDTLLKTGCIEKETHDSLRQLHSHYTAKQALKIKRQPPPGSRSSRQYTHIKRQSNTQTNSLHTTYFLRELSHTGKPQKLVVFKEAHRSISEIEAFNSECYRLLLGERHPKVRPVHDHTSGARIGTASSYISGFTPLAEKYKKIERSMHYAYRKADGTTGLCSPKELAQQLNQSKMMDIWTAAYLEEENDLHDGNYGFNKDGMSVKIDDDQSAWELTCPYVADGGIDKDNKEVTGVKPKEAFPITATDITHFPRLTHAHPRHWIFQSTEISPTVLKHLLEDDQAQIAKYQMFLKRALMPDSVYENIGSTYIRNENIRDRFAQHKCERTKQLQKALINTPAFRACLHEHYAVIYKNIVKDFEQYNRRCERKALQIPMNDVHENMTQMLRDIKKANAEHLSIQRKNKIHTIPTPTASKPGFFKRHSWIKHALIGAAIGLAVVGALAIIAYTWGAATPILLGAAKTVGMALGIKATLAATATGATLASTGIASTFTLIGTATGIGLATDFSGKTSSPKPTPTPTPPQSALKATQPAIPPRRQPKKATASLREQSIFKDKKSSGTNSPKLDVAIMPEEKRACRPT